MTPSTIFYRVLPLVVLSTTWCCAARAEPLIYLPGLGELNRTGVSSFSPQTLKQDISVTAAMAYDEASGYLYLADEYAGTVYRVKPDGSSFQRIVQGLYSPEHLVIDTLAGKIYVSAYNDIMRFNLDGSGLENAVTPSQEEINGLAIDVAARKLYWAIDTQPGGKIERANLDGTNRETLISSNLFPEEPGKDLVLDVRHSTMYYIDAQNWKIYRANLDGSGVTELFSGQSWPGALALNSSMEMLYWVDNSGRSLNIARIDGSYRHSVSLVNEEGLLHIAALLFEPSSFSLYASLGGTGMTKISRLDPLNFTMTDVHVSDIYWPVEFVFSRTTGKMYWADFGNGTIMRANPDGSQQEVIVRSSAYITGFALDEAGQKVYWDEDASGELRRASLDGSNEEVVMENSPGVGVRLDRAGGYIYKMLGDTIRRIKLDDVSKAEDVVTGIDVWVLELDLAGRKIYWTGREATSDLYKLQRANLDGSNVEDLVVEGPEEFPAYLALDTEAGKVYWINGHNGALERANLDGSSREVVFMMDIGLVQRVTGIAVLPDTGLNGTWNSFLGMANVLELSNPAAAAVSAQVTLRGDAGQTLGQQTVSVPAEGKLDLPLHNIAGFTANAYGTVRVETGAAPLFGSIVRYAAAPGSLDYDFAAASPISAPLLGASYIASNTLTPGRAADGLSVKEWLSLVNLDQIERGFTVVTYNLDGTIARQMSTSLPALSRRDFENAGPPAAALIEIIPQTSSTPYLAQAVRYGQTAGSPNSAYRFAIETAARKGTARGILYAPVSTTENSDAWLELANPGAMDADIVLDIYDQTGSARTSQHVLLPAHGQKHFYVNEVLPAGFTGYARIRAELGEVMAQSLSYFLDSSGAALNAGVFASREEPALSSHGSYNLFLGMRNWLKLINVTDNSQTAIVRLGLPSGTETVTYRTIPAHGEVDLGLHELQNYGLGSDTYGKLTVEAPGTGRIYSELLRLKHSPAGAVEFAVSTPVQ